MHKYTSMVYQKLTLADYLTIYKNLGLIKHYVNISVLENHYFDYT